MLAIPAKATGKHLWIVYLALVVLFSAAATAKPVTYTIWTITDGQLGTWSFHNARVYLTFKGDTSTVQNMAIPDPGDPADCTPVPNANCLMADLSLNATGAASVTVISGSKIVTANFAPNQIVVTVDHGTSGFTHFGARGLAFSSFNNSIPGGVDPLYPLGLGDGTVDWGDYEGDNSVSTETSNLSFDLQSNMGVNGRAFSCSNFNPDTFAACAPAPALVTDHGNFYLYQPYQTNSSGGAFVEDPLTGGFFIAQVSGTTVAIPGDKPILAGPVTPPSPTPTLRKATVPLPTRHPIAYNGYVITDVSLGGQSYAGAQVNISFSADTSTAMPVVGHPHTFVNTVGVGHVTIQTNGTTLSANFNAGQIYVYYDEDTASVGFGSAAGGRGYPLRLQANQDSDGLVENSSIGAVADIALNPGDASNYSAPTANLATNLTNETVLSGAASSCVSFDITTSTCNNLTPVALKTDKGDFYLYEPYTAIDFNNVGPFSINWGIFWSQLIQNTFTGGI